MGLLDWIKGGGKSSATPEEVFAKLRQAFSRKDGRLLTKICRSQRQVIEDSFPRWRQVPEHVRDDPAEVQAFAQTVIATAQVFAHELGDPSLLHSLEGGGGGNPMDEWGRRLEEASALLQQHAYAEAQSALSELVADIGELQGTGVDHFLGFAYGKLGEAFFGVGQAREAIPHFGDALQRCEKGADMDGVVAHLENLLEVHRYLGLTTEAAGYAARIADVLEQTGDTPGAERMRARRDRIAAGEPRNRVCFETDTGSFEVDELPADFEGHVRLIFKRNRIALPLSEVRSEEGCRLATAGHYGEALELFDEAAHIDPHNPAPLYQRGICLLEMTRFEEGRDALRRVEELAPGWFQVRTDIWIAEALADGRLPVQSFAALRRVQDGPLSAEAAIAEAEETLQASPELAPLWVVYATRLQEAQRTAQAREALERALQHADEVDVRTRALVQLATLEESDTKRRELAQEAAALGGNLTAAAMARQMLRSP